MTESEWVECFDPMEMLEFSRGRVGERKLRLFAAACCRSEWGGLDAGEREAVSLLEMFAEGKATEQERASLFEKIRLAPNARENPIGQDLLDRDARFGAAAAFGLLDFDPDVDRARWSEIVREILSKTFHPISINLAWLTPTVTGLAQAAYEERALPSGELDRDRLAVLADALEEAGCDHADILAHLRGPGPHVQGCWVVDLSLGKQ